MLNIARPLLLLAICCSAISNSAAQEKNVKVATDTLNAEWQSTILAAIDSFPERGGYYTGGKPNALFANTTWQGLHAAFQMGKNDRKPYFCPQKPNRRSAPAPHIRRLSRLSQCGISKA